MTKEQDTVKESALVEVSPETQALVKEEMPQESDEVKNETMALIETIKTKAQSEAQKAGEFTRDTYLDAVRSVREEIEKLNLFDKERIEESIELMQKEVEKDWDSLVKQATNLGDRLNEAAKAAWEALTAPRPKDSPPDSE